MEAVPMMVWKLFHIWFQPGLSVKGFSVKVYLFWV